MRIIVAILQGEAPDSPDVHFEPVVTLSPVDIETLEDEEEEIIKL